MCVILASPSRQFRPSLQTLKACARANPHGSGLAWVQSPRAVCWVKALCVEAIHDHLLSMSGPVVVHFRIATVGVVCDRLCHPFPIGPRAEARLFGSARSVLFHNGTWSAWRDYAARQGIRLAGPVSDSRVAAVRAHLHGFESLATITSRFAMLSASRGLRLLGEWSKVDGVRFSNLRWQDWQ